MANDPQQLGLAQPYLDRRVRYSVPTPSGTKARFLCEMCDSIDGFALLPRRRLFQASNENAKCCIVSVVTPGEVPVDGYPDNESHTFLLSGRGPWRPAGDIDERWPPGIANADPETVYDICDPSNLSVAFGPRYTGRESPRRGDRLWCYWNPRHNWMQPMAPFGNIQMIQVSADEGTHGGSNQCEVLSPTGEAFGAGEVCGIYQPWPLVNNVNLTIYPWYGLGQLCNGYDVPMWNVFAIVPGPGHTNPPDDPEAPSWSLPTL